MKNIHWSLLFFLLSACHAGVDKKAEIDMVKKDTAKAADTTVAIRHADVMPASTLIYLWTVDDDGNQRTKKRNPGFKQEWLNVDSMLKGINQLYPNVSLEKVKISGDTLYSQIPDSEYLSEQMGTTGAALWLDNCILNLTAVPGIRYVKIDFEEGDHASPGTWSKKDMENILLIR